jgi:DNA-binding MarR family transcriptional regulator
LVERRASPSDRRAVVAELTRAGRRLARELEESRRQFLSELLAALKSDEGRELVRLFAKVTEALRDRGPGEGGS